MLYPGRFFRNARKNLQSVAKFGVSPQFSRALDSGLSNYPDYY